MRKLTILSPLFTLLLAALMAPSLYAQTSTEQANTDADEEAEAIEEVIVTGSQIRGAAINEALAVSVIDSQDIEALGLESGDELLDAMP